MRWYNQYLWVLLLLGLKVAIATPDDSDDNFQFFSRVTSRVSASCFASALDTVSFHWLDNVINSVASFDKNHGAASLWGVTRSHIQRRMLNAGLKQRLKGVAPAQLATFTAYHGTLVLTEHWECFECANVIAGVTAGIVDAGFSCPKENGSTLFEEGIRNSMSYLNKYRCFPAVMGRSSIVPIVFAGSEILLHHRVFPEGWNTMFFAGFVTGSMAPLITCPCDAMVRELVKFRKATYYETASKLFKEGRLYVGLPVRMMRASGAGAIVLGIIDYCINEQNVF